MESRSHRTSTNASESSYVVAAEQALPTPHFDEESIQSAQPAVPLVQIRARRFWRLGLLLFVSSVVGGALGLGLSRYQNNSAQTAAPPVAPHENGVSSGSEAQDENSVSTGSGSDRIVKSTPNESELVTGPGDKASDARLPASGEAMTDADPDARAALNGALNEWIAATNARDIKRQMGFYNPTMQAFYRTRNVPRAAVRAEKSRVFGRANRIDIRAAAPGIRVSRDGRTATMRFRKKYAIAGGGEDRRGEVVQELRWRRTDDGWKIISERDLRVIN